jgi:predicted MFS family arabinose efflux permease
MGGERAVVLILTLIQVLHLTDFVIVMPLGPQFMTMFGLSPQQFSLVVSSYTFASCASGLLGALVIDRFDRKRALLALFAGFTLANLACALADGFATLVAARVMAGAFGGVLGALIFAIIGDLIPFERRGRATGVVMSGFAIASVLGVPLGLQLATWWGWHAPFIMLTGAGALVWALAATVLPPMRGHFSDEGRIPPVATLRAVFADPGHWRAFALMVALIFAGFTVIPFFAPFLVTNLGLSEHQLVLVYLLGGVCTIVSSLIGRWADRHGKTRVFSIVAALSLVPLLVFTNLPALAPPAALPLAAVLAVSTLFIVLVSGRFVPAMALVTAAVEPRLRGAFMAVNSSLQSLAMGAAASITGAIVARPDPHGPLLHFGWAGGVAACATLLCLVLVRRLILRTA